MATLVLLRHGQSTWNADNLFTGWYDADLSPDGEEEAREAGRRLAGAGCAPDVVHTSVQTRAIRTAELALRELNRLWIPVRRHWRLNERHYGALQGLNKAETAAMYGDEQVRVWRRSYEVPPPALELSDPRYVEVAGDPRYADMPPDVVPPAECLQDVVVRMLPYWYDAVVPDLRHFGCVLVSAHGNSLRALVKHLKSIPDADIPTLEIPTGVPWVFELDGRLAPTSDRLLR